MKRVVPNKEWLERESEKRGVQMTCPFANSHKCPRYFDSLVLLSRANVIAGVPQDKEEELEYFWKNTSFSALCDEETPTIYRTKFGGVSAVHNFCPEVSYKHFYYYADHMQKYIDELDQEVGHRIAERDNLDNDWKFTWMDLSPRFYSDCEVFESVKEFNEGQNNSFLKKLHPNILLQLNRMENCLDNDDPTGVLHAASNVLETMAKDVTGNPNVASKSLGSFFEQFKKNTTLPLSLIQTIKDIYDMRNKLPTAGHGSLVKPDLTMTDAVTITAMTKAIVEIEYRLNSLCLK